MTNLQEFQNKVEQFEKITEQVDALSDAQRLSPNAPGLLEPGRTELTRTRDVVFVSATDAHSEISDILSLEPGLLDQSVIRIGSSDQSRVQSTETAEILLPQGTSALLKDRNILAVAPGAKHLVQRNVVETLQTSDAVLFAVNKRLTEGEVETANLAISLSQTRAKASPQIASVYTAKDLSPEEFQTLIAANADAFGDDIDIETYIASVDDDRLIGDLQTAANRHRLSVLKGCVTALLPDINASISNLENYIQTWTSELAKRQDYDQAVEKRDDFQAFKRAKKAQWTLEFQTVQDRCKEIRRELKNKLKPHNAGKVIRAITYHINGLTNADFRKSNIQTTIEGVEKPHKTRV